MVRCNSDCVAFVANLRCGERLTRKKVPDRLGASRVAVTGRLVHGLVTDRATAEALLSETP
jgi:hypothetical protein